MCKVTTKLIVWFILVFLLMLIGLNTFGLYYLKDRIITEQVSLLYEEAQSISQEYLSNYYSQYTSLETIRSQLLTVDTFLNVHIWAVDRNGDILIDTGTNNTYVHKNLNTAAPGLLDSNYIKNTTLGDLLPSPVLAVCYTIHSDLNIQGYIIMLEPMENLKHSACNYLNVINVCLVILGVVLIGTFLYLYLIMILPLNTLNKGIHEYANGNFNHEIKLKPKDEFKDFAASIQYMASELANLEEYQKKFIANISHDFRSPLTSIKGYAEAIKDGTIPYEKQNKYLDIILFESDRLTKLTTNLLTLNNIKHNGRILEITSFDMNQIIKSTASTFEGICKKKRITFQLIFETKQSLVCADKNKIQQVLYNLIDNAIKFSPNNSVIEIGTEEKNDKLFISIKDHGIGIPSDSLHKIWERFYKTDLSRGKDKKGTGLGLSIVKEIINAHGENITVASTMDIGTEFLFTLPMSEEG